MRHTWLEVRGLTQKIPGNRWTNHVLWKQSKTTRSSNGTLETIKELRESAKSSSMDVGGEQNDTNPGPSARHGRRVVNPRTWLSCLAERWPRNFAESMALLWVVYDGWSNASEEYAWQDANVKKKKAEKKRVIANDRRPRGESSENIEQPNFGFSRAAPAFDSIFVIRFYRRRAFRLTVNTRRASRRFW